MPNPLRTQAYWIGVLPRRVLVALLLSLAFAVHSLAADASAPPSNAGFTPPEDLIPSIPKRPKPPRPASADWAQWNDVERFRGYYECRRTGERIYGSPPITFYDALVATATFEFQPADYQGNVTKQWTVVNGKVVGSYHQAGSSPSWTYTVEGLFDGPASDIMFDGVNQRGEWQFHTAGQLPQPYARNLDGVRRWNDGEGRNREEHQVLSHPSNSYPHAVIRGVVPGGRPTPIRGVRDSTEGTVTNGLTEMHARVLLVPEYKDLELVVEIEGVAAGGKTVPYEKWIPLGTVTGAAGSLLKIKARLQTDDGGAVTVHVDNFTFTLINTSREPGVCMNYPLIAASAGGKPVVPDMKFEPSGPTDAERQELEMPPALDDPGHPHAEARVDCFDFGAWSDLWVTAELTDGRSITGHLKGDPTAIMMPIPKRSGGSYIADAWKAEHGVTAGDNDDSEKLPSAGKTPGDGFTLYEEYRGFVENGRHLRGDLGKIDFFVRNYIDGDARPGIDLFARLTGAEVHDRLRDAEFDPEKRVMNANHDRGAHRVDQHGVYIRTQAGRDGAAARFTTASVRGRPRLCLEIVVQSREAETSVTTSENLPASELVFAYDRAIVHELLHAVGVEHHGDRDYSSSYQLVFADDPRNKTGKPVFWTGYTMNQIAVTITDERSGRDLAAMLAPDLMLARERDRLKGGMDHSKELTKGWWDGHRGANAIATKYSEDETTEILYNEVFGRFYWYVGAEHGECSGDEDCVTRYYFAKLYEKKGVARAYYYISDKRTARAGLGLCRSRAGTGINAAGRKPQPRYGDTYPGWGECADWIVFNDAAPDEPAPKEPAPKK